ncbi:MAG: phosphoglycerate mutase family protein [Pseudoxanthomonas sp.]
MIRPSLLLLSCVCAGCASLTVPAADHGAAGVDFVLVRHAEQAATDPDDPPLTAAGQARAQALADALAGEPLRAIFVTEFQRTQQTAAPTAQAHRLREQRYFSRAPAAEQARQWRSAAHAGTVLVVGHEDSLPELAAALCACAVAPMDAGEYDRLMRIHLGAGAAATLAVSRYGAPSP